MRMIKKKDIILFGSVLVLSTGVYACGNASTNTTVAQDTKSESIISEPVMSEFTLEELATYNGKDGTKAYIAVDGVVYDVTDVSAWKNGGHNGYEAGQDLTEAIKKAPHGTSKLDGLTIVGTLAK